MSPSLSYYRFFFHFVAEKSILMRENMMFQCSVSKWKVLVKVAILGSFLLSLSLHKMLHCNEE